MALKIEFRKSRESIEWDESYDSILELAEDNGIDIESECEAGVCGTCRTKLLAGRVSMEITDGLEPGDQEQNIILPCVAIPVTDIVLKA